MTYEEAIEELSGHYLVPVNGTDDEYARVHNEAIDKAIVALNKQIPHKPVGRHTDYRCSVCGTRVRSGQGSSSRTKDTVCRKCFTVIDWSKE